jgi:chromosome segregation ATPase
MTKNNNYNNRVLFQPNCFVCCNNAPVVYTGFEDGTLKILDFRNVPMSSGGYATNINNNNINNTNNNMNYANNNVTLSYLPDAEVEKIKQEQATLKSDNIIFREDINRLTDLNQHLETELIEQRNRNIELANENEQISQEKSKIEKELKTALETIEKIKLKETSLEQYYNERLMLQNRMRENETELKKALEEKSKYEIDFKVLQARYNELVTKNEKINEEYNGNKKKHEEEFNKIEEKIEILTKEIEKLQSENGILRLDNEKKGNEINNISLQRDNFKEKFEEEKRRNEILCGKIEEIENEFRNLQNDKNMEMVNRYKIEEIKKNKYENKNKIISELQTRIQNYKNQRLMMKKNEDDDFQY